MHSALRLATVKPCATWPAFAFTLRHPWHQVKAARREVSYAAHLKAISVTEMKTINKILYGCAADRECEHKDIAGSAGSSASAKTSEIHQVHASFWLVESAVQTPIMPEVGRRGDRLFLFLPHTFRSFTLTNF